MGISGMRVGDRDEFRKFFIYMGVWGGEGFGGECHSSGTTIIEPMIVDLSWITLDRLLHISF